MRGCFLLWVGLMTLAVLCPAAERPNIVLVMADDLGWGDPSYNGGWIDTPALDAMAAEGLRFDRFYAASAVCSPTRGSCLTGRNPIRLGIPNANSGRLAADETPLSEVLGGAGYATGHFGKWHLGTLTTLRRDSNRGAPGNTSVYSPPWQHGYDDCFATEAKVPTFHPMRRTVNGLPEPLDFDDANFYGTYYWQPPADPATWASAAEGTAVGVTDNLSGDDSRVIMDRVIPFVREAVAAGEPFFTVVWFHTPHKPLPDPEGSSGVDSADAYIDAVVNMDTEIGRLRGELERLGVAEETMLWFCSDNGPENGVGRSGPFRARKRSLHEGGVRVPGILVWPEKIGAARASDFPAVTSDYYPTILDYLEIEVPNQKPLDGISLRGVIENTDAEREQPIGFHYTSSRSWVGQQYKLISKDGGSSFELYDLLADGSETTDLAAANPAIVARMTNEFRTWAAAVAADTEYVAPGEVTTVVLSAADGAVDGAFDVDVAFSRVVTGLVAEDFLIGNGRASSLEGVGMDYTLTVEPIAPGQVSVELPAGRVEGPDSEPNLASNRLDVLYRPAGAPVGGARVVIDDHFDDGGAGGWVSQGNVRTATHRISASGSTLVSEVVATQSSSNRGIASATAFDPLERGGFSVTFVVESVGQAPDANGFFVGVVGDNGVFFRDGATRNFGLTFFGQEGRTNSFGGLGLNYGDNFGSTGAELRLSDADAGLASFLDGFTATVEAGVEGWRFEVTGMSDAGGAPVLFADRGTWVEAGTTFESLFGIDRSWHAVSSNQLAAAGTHLVSFDRIRVVSGLADRPIVLEVGRDEAGGEFELRWETVEGRRYQIERSTDLNAWTDVETVTATGMVTVFADADADPDSPGHYYRIRPL